MYIYIDIHICLVFQISSQFECFECRDTSMLISGVIIWNQPQQSIITREITQKLTYILASSLNPFPKRIGSHFMTIELLDEYIYIYYNMYIVYVNLDGYIKLMLSWVFFTFSFKTCVFLYVLEVCIPLLDHHHRAMHLRAAAARFKCCKARREDKAWPNCINAGLSWWDVDDALGMEILGFLRFCFL